MLRGSPRKPKLCVVASPLEISAVAFAIVVYIEEIKEFWFLLDGYQKAIILHFLPLLFVLVILTEDEEDFTCRPLVFIQLLVRIM